MRRAVLALVLTLITTEALATDGTSEINQTCAVQTGCFAGDSAGFPVTISAPGSYQLTSNLTLPNQNTDGITFATSSVANVSIDLGGFAIGGPVVCTGVPLACLPASGTGHGIVRLGPGNSGISVENGSITGMGQSGILLGDRAQVSDLRVHSNRSSGIVTGSGSLVSANTSSQNGQIGIGTGSASTVSGNSVYLNGSNGISAGNGSTLSNNSAVGNAAEGMSAGSGSTVSGNVASGNNGDGISLLTGSTISGNSSLSNNGAGIAAGAGSTIQGNAVRSNGGFGLDLGGQSAYMNNTMSSNDDGSVNGAVGVNAGGNVCDGSLTCP